MTLPWFKCYPRNFREGLAGLTCEERGAYATVLMLIYERGDAIPDDASWIASHLWCSVRTWAKLRAALIVKGKLFALETENGACLMNRRAAEELAQTAGICTSRAVAGKEGAKRRAANRIAEVNENNDIVLANANGLVEQTSSKRLADIEKGRREDSEASPNGEPSAAEAANPDRKAWESGVTVLTIQGGMTVPAAKTFFGGLLKANGIEPRDLLSAIGECEATGTRDPKAYLAGAAKSRATRRQTGPPKRVGFV